MNFSAFNIPKPLLNALQDMGVETPTTIQEKTFPVVLSGRDMVGIAQTGTGKTLAFLLPCLSQWKYSKQKSPSIVIVVPTRELVMQVADEVEKLAQYMSLKVVGVYGGVSMSRQTPLLIDKFDVLVGTPGRMLDFLLNGTLKFKLVRKFIIDEVDEMLHMGFRPQLVRLMDFLPARRQNLMFSATMTAEISTFIADYFIDPQEVEAARTGTPLKNIKQVAIPVPNFHTKIQVLDYLLRTDPRFSKVLLFVSTKQMADDVFEKMAVNFPNELGIIHSNKSQNNRFENLNQFNNGNFRMLIATDIVARGLDFEDVTHVVNFDVPDEAENYMHRIGRTGRIDKKGVSITFLTKMDGEKRKQIETLMNKPIPLMAMPEDVPVSDTLTAYDLPPVKMKNVLTKLPDPKDSGGAFHEKLEKNRKVNVKRKRLRK